MNFNELMNIIFGAEWLGTAVQIIEGALAMAIAFLLSKTKNKLLNSENKYLKDFGRILDENIELKNQTRELTEQGKNTEQAVVTLCNMFATVFVSSKGIDSDTKLKIGKFISELDKLGIDTKAIENTAIKTTESLEKVDKAVEKAKEELDKLEEDCKQSNETAKGIEADALDVYNSILNND